MPWGAGAAPIVVAQVDRRRGRQVPPGNSCVVDLGEVAAKFGPLASPSASGVMILRSFVILCSIGLQCRVVATGVRDWAGCASLTHGTAFTAGFDAAHKS